MTGLFGAFGAIGLVVACLGLLGLAAHATERRTKEIGIRKVLGARAAGIVLLLGREFVGLVAVSALVAAPAAYLAMRAWLEAFAVRAPLGPGLFVLVGLGAVLVALAAVSAQTLRAATADPVRALRSE